MSRIAVIIPVRNCSAYVRAALESLRLQTFPHFNVYIIDDHSTDNTCEICCEFLSDRRFRLMRSPSRGLVSALNYGIQISDEQFIARMDGDDIAAPFRFDHQVRALDRNPEIGLVAGQHAIIDARGHETGEVSRFPLNSYDLWHHLRSRGNAISHPTVMMRRKVVEQVGAYRRAFEAAEDFDLWLRASDRFKLANLPDVILKYRKHNDQVSYKYSFRQSFSRDLAIISMKARSSSGKDIIEFDDDVPDLRSIATSYSPEVRFLLELYDSVQKLELGNPIFDTEHDIILKGIREMLLSDSRRYKARLLGKLARNALRQKSLTNLISCLPYARKTNILHFVQSVLDPI